MNFENLTWTCHICGKERPDEKISVLSKPLFCIDKVVGQENIRYCNDNKACIKKAKTFSLLKDSPAGCDHKWELCGAVYGIRGKVGVYQCAACYSWMVEETQIERPCFKSRR